MSATANINAAAIVVIDYTNWRGERSTRRIVPIGLDFDCNEWHPARQWLLHAFDMEKEDYRFFAMTGVHSWQGPTPEPQQ